jgi:creatinase
VTTPREDIETVLEPGMVISIEPTVTFARDQHGASGSRELDILIITETATPTSRATSIA